MLVVIWFTVAIIFPMELVMADDDQYTDYQFYLVSHVKEYTIRIQRAILNQDITGSLAENIVG